MSNVPADLRYSKSHEWVRVEEGGMVTMGITDHAQELLGDLVFVELPDVGRSLEVGEECAVVESVKAASDVYSPISGEVTEVNEALADSPQVVNEDAFGDGWMMKLKVADASDLDAMMDVAAYEAHLAAEDH